MANTINYNLFKYEDNNIADFKLTNPNFDKIDTELKKNADKSIALETELQTVKQSGVDAKTGMVTSINSKKTVPDVTLGDSWNTLIQRVADIKEGSGNALKADVRRGKTFTNNDGIEYIGELDITASKILAGQNIGGIIGTATSDANAVAGDMLNGKTAYVNGSKITGTLIKQPSVMYNCPIALTGGKLNVQVPIGAYTTAYDTPDRFIAQTIQLIEYEPDLVAGNIKKGINIFGVAGMLEPKKYKLESDITINGSYTRIECGFEPKTIVAKSQDGTFFGFYSPAIGSKENDFVIRTSSGNTYVEIKLANSAYTKRCEIEIYG